MRVDRGPVDPVDSVKSRGFGSACDFLKTGFV